MGSQRASTSYNSDLLEMEKNYEDYALSFINRLPDQKTIATMAPIGTDIGYAPSQPRYSDSFKTFFQQSYEPNFVTSLDMGFSFTEYQEDTKFAGSSSALKKLFMEPYRAGPLSLFCHRVGKTIYVDTDTQQNDGDFKEKIQSINENQGYVPSSYSTLPGLTLYENLIWNCKEASQKWNERMGICKGTELALDFSSSALTPMFESYSYKIQPQNSVPGDAYIWEFHNTKMLVDSELPIFGGGAYPALTIRLSEGKGMPISVLTGVDMLLDQLMHHIKETIIVHHFEGSVQKYDVVVQNKIPFLEGSEFDPLKLKAITGNMYNFLSSNMTQQGHTYWLCRESNSDELRLYDLTTICPEFARNRNKNPFLIPVVNLMYKISCKLIYETMEYRSQKVTNVTWGLLTAADKLLENAHVPEFRACINYLLSGLYLNYDVDNRSTKKKGGKTVDQDQLLKGLSEEMFKGYEKFPGIVKVSELIEDPPEEEAESSNGSKYRIPNSKLRIDSTTQALDYAKEALSCLEKCRHDDEEIPYVADNHDDISAYNEIDHRTDDTIFNHLRHALLVRAANCYLILTAQASAINSGIKMFKFSQCGLQCCTSVLSGYPSKRHEMMAKVLIGPLVACFVKAVLLMSVNVQDTSNLQLSYRESEIIKIATEHVNLLDQYNFSRCWNFKSSAVTFIDWTVKIDRAVSKFLPMLKEDFNGRKKLQNKALLAVAFDQFEAASKISQVLTEIGGLIMKGLQSKIAGKTAEEIAVLFDGTPEMSVTSAVNFYDKSIELMEFCPNTEEFNRIKSILLINSVIAKKVWMILGRARKIEFLEQNALAEDVFAIYHKAFSYMPKELKTTDGVDIHVRCLVEYSDVLLMFTMEHAKDLDFHFPNRRKAYYEACLRNYDIIMKNYKEVPPVCLTQLANYKTHVLFVLLQILAQELNLEAIVEPSRSACKTKKIRATVSKYMNFFETCVKHAEDMTKMNIFDGARRPEAQFCKDMLPCFTSPHLTGAEKVRCLKLTTAWAKAMLDLIPLTTPETIATAKQYAIRSTVEIKSIASGMKHVVDQTSSNKLNAVDNCLIIKNASKADVKLINLIKKKLSESIKHMT